jgi:hypothetical protein
MKYERSATYDSLVAIFLFREYRTLSLMFRWHPLLRHSLDNKLRELLRLPASLVHVQPPWLAWLHLDRLPRGRPFLIVVHGLGGDGRVLLNAMSRSEACRIDFQFPNPPLAFGFGQQLEGPLALQRGAVGIVHGQVHYRHKGVREGSCEDVGLPCLCGGD